MIAAIGARPFSLEKGMERVENARARNIARTHRFLDARLRTIGLDTDALDEQMREQRARREMEQMAADAEVCRNENVYKHVALQEAEERRLRDKELTRMRLEWLEQMKFKKEKEQREKYLLHAGLDVDACGASAVQKMEGEDLNKAARVALQHKQTREWKKQQAEERLAKKTSEEKEAAIYLAYLEKVNEKQEEFSGDEEATRKALNYTIQDENLRRAAERVEEKARWEELEQEANAQELRFREDFLREDEGEDGTASQEKFKGLSRKQKAELLQSNADLRERAIRRVEQEKQEEAAWYLQQEKMRVAMEREDEQERRRVKEAEDNMSRELQEQQLELHQRQMREKNFRFGGIDYTHGIYAGFGKSCR